MPEYVEKPRARTTQENRFQVSFSAKKKVVGVLGDGVFRRVSCRGFRGGVLPCRGWTANTPKLANPWFLRQRDNGLESATACW